MNTEYDLLSGIREQIESMIEFSHVLAECASPDYQLQEYIGAEDLVLPLQLCRLPNEEMYSGHDQLQEFFDLIDFVAAQYVTSFISEYPVVGLYVSAISLAGICFFQSPESAEFGIAGRCQVLVNATEVVDAVPAEVVSSFVAELYRHTDHCPENFWNFPWVRVSLLATSLRLSSRPSVRADLSNKLVNCIGTMEWTASLQEKRNEADSADEAEAMSELLRSVRCKE